MSTQKRVEIQKNFSTRINELIGDSSVSAFARQVGLKQAALDRYSKGINSPAADALVTISSKCGVSVDWLLGLTDERTPKRQTPTDFLAAEKAAVEEMLRKAKESGAKIIGDPTVPQVITVGQEQKKPLHYPDQKKTLHYTMKVPISSPVPALSESDLEHIVSIVESRVLARLTRPHSRHHYVFSKK